MKIDPETIRAVREYLANSPLDVRASVEEIVDLIAFLDALPRPKEE